MCGWSKGRRDRGRRGEVEFAFCFYGGGGACLVHESVWKSLLRHGDVVPKNKTKDESTAASNLDCVVSRSVASPTVREKL